MKKFALLAGTIFFIFAIVSCGGGGKYADAKAVMEDYCDLMDNFADDLNKATTAADAAKAINAFSDGMDSLIPKMNEASKNHPEMKSQKEDEIPAELKPVMDRMMKEVMPKFAGSMGKMQQFMNDPAVQEAYQKMGQVMTKIE